MMTNKPEEELELVRGSGNVFRDASLPNPDLQQAKAILSTKIIGILDDRNLSVRAAAKATGYSASDFSEIRNANLKRFTLDRLIKIINALDDDVQVSIDIQSRGTAATSAEVPQPA